MPRLSEIMGQSSGQSSGRIRLSDLIRGGQQAPDFSNADLPPIAGALGFSDEFQKATGAGSLDAFRPALADLFGNYEDVAAALQKVAPGAKVVKDRDGLETLELPDGRRFRMNNKGLDTNEVAASVARVGSFAPAARLTSGIAGLGGRVAAGAGLGGASDLTQQALAGRGVTEDGQNIDLAQTAISAGLSGLGEAVAPAVGSGYRALRSALSSDSSKIAAGRQIAASLGQEVDDKVALELGKRVDEIKGGAKPEAVLAEVTSGMRLTRGQKTGDYAQIAREQQMLHDPNNFGGTLLRENAQSQINAVNSGRDALLRGVGAPDNPSAGAETIAGAVRDRYKNMREGVDTAYNAFRASNAQVSDRAFSGLPSRLRQAVSEIALDPNGTPAALRALKMLESDFAKLAPQRSGYSDLATDVAVPLKEVERIRARLNSVIGTAVNPTDKRAVVTVKRELDAWVDDTLFDSVVNAEKSVVDQMKQARGLRAELGRLFEGKDAAGKLVNRLATKSESPDQLANALWGASQISGPATANTAKAIKAVIGDNPEAWNAFRGTVLLKATTAKGGEAGGMQALSTNLKELLRTRPDLMKSLFSPKEISQIGQLANAAASITPKALPAGSAGPGRGVFRMISDMATKSGPLAVLLRGPLEVMQGYRALAPVAPRTVGGTAAGAGAPRQ